MNDESAKEAAPEPIEVRCYFVRERNALLVRGDFAPLYIDFYLHLMQHEIRHDQEQDRILKDGLAALCLHLASRPRNEAVAWTLNWQDPLQNVFVTGSNRVGNVVGRLFTEDVRERDKNLFVAQVTSPGEGARQSMIEAKTLDFFEVGEAFYQQSEQRQARYFHCGDDEFALITAQPDCDHEWLGALNESSLNTALEAETLTLLETRVYRYDCGCGPEHIYAIIANMSDEALQTIFAESEVAAASCPRCGARYTITSEALEAYRRDTAS